MRIDTNNYREFLHNPPHAVIDSLKDKGYTDKEIDNILEESEVLLTIYKATRQINKFTCTMPRKKNNITDLFEYRTRVKLGAI